MKWIISIIAGLLAPVCCLAGEGYVIKGKVSGIISGYVTILEIPENTAPLHEELPERVRIVDGEFTISGKVTHPGPIELKVSTRKIKIILENTDYTIHSTLQTLSGDQVKGGILNDQYHEYLNSNTNPLEYVKQFPARPISGYLANLFAREYQEVQDVYNVLSLENKTSWFGLELGNKLARFKNTQAGKEMPDFTMTGPDGQPFTIKSMAGKVVVLDFWASWCGPCRAFIPTMRKYYEEFHPKGVEFVAVSFDDSKEKWQQAMEETQMEWKQGLAAGGFGKDAAVKNMLNIQSIPHVIVVGKDGKIAAWLEFSMKSKLPEILSKLNP